MNYKEIIEELKRINQEIENEQDLAMSELVFLQEHQAEIKAEFPENMRLMEMAGIPEPLARVKQRYTKGDCHAIAEFLDALILHNPTVIADIADALGYPPEAMRDILGDLGATFWAMIETFNAHEYADTAQDAEICDIQPRDPYAEELWNNINTNE